MGRRRLSTAYVMGQWAVKTISIGVFCSSCSKAKFAFHLFLSPFGIIEVVSQTTGIIKYIFDIQLAGYRRDQTRSDYSLVLRTVHALRTGWMGYNNSKKWLSSSLVRYFSNLPASSAFIIKALTYFSLSRTVTAPVSSSFCGREVIQVVLCPCTVG